MSARATTGHDVAADRRRRWASRAGTVVAVAVSACSALIAVSFAATDAATDGSTAMTGLYMLSTLVGLALAGLLVLRRSYPVVLCVVASAAAVVLPIDASAALLTLPWVLATATARTSAACAVLTGAATAAALARDALRDPASMVFAVIDQQTGAVTSSPAPSAFVIGGVALLGASLAVGLVRRSRATAARAQELQEAQASTTAVLRDQMTRQEERELIAREVHDTVAHHIAAISLHASALEVTRGDDSEVSGTAREIRTSAQQAISELRSLLSDLRADEPAVAAAPGASLDDLAPLLDQLRRDGAHLTSTVFVSGADTAPPAVTRAAFRIVQESVTNALKHAPGERVDVTVRAAPADGVGIRVANPLPATPSTARSPAGIGTGHGLQGMHERASAVGGRLDARALDGTFVVDATLPWDGRAAGDGARV